MRLCAVLVCMLSTLGEAVFTQRVSKNLFGFFPTCSDFDSAQNLYAAGILDGTFPGYQLAKIETTLKSQVLSKISVTPSNAGAVFTRPSSVTVVGSLVVVVGTENINKGTTSSQISVVHGFSGETTFSFVLRRASFRQN